MHYEIRGLLEENVDWLLDGAAQTVGKEPTYWNLPDEVKQQIAFDAAYNRLIGFHAMWTMIEGNEPEDEFYNDVIDMVNKNMERMLYAVDEYETEAKQERDNTSSIPTYDITSLDE